MKTLTSNKLGSLLLTLTAAATLAFVGTGCVVTAGADVVLPDLSITQVSVDSGAKMTATPGTGVGVFVQYEAGGHWNVSTTCDTDKSGESCRFDLIVSTRPGVAIENVQAHDLEPEDDLSLAVDGSIELLTETTSGTDGVTFDTRPGATIELDALLDGDSAQRFVFAVQDGKLVRGVATNPVDFTPSAR